jgi:hypothetical protein
MAKIIKIADGAFFVPSYSEQTIHPAYSTQTTIQSFGGEDDADELKGHNSEEKEKRPLR